MSTEDTRTPEEIALARGDVINDENPPGTLVGEEDEEEEVEVAAEAEEEPEVEAAAEEEEDDAPGDAPAEEEAPLTVPKARFDEVQRKSRDKVQALEQRLSQMEKQQTHQEVAVDLSVQETEIDKLQDQYEDLLMEGELEKARAIRRQVSGKQTALMDARLMQQGAQASQLALEQMRFDTQLAHFEASHAAINPDSDAFNEDLANEVAEVLQAFRSRGYTSTAALNKAMHYVLPETAEAKDPSILRSQKSQQARKRALKAVKSSPPDFKNVGKDSDKSGSDDGLPDVTKMSTEQFDKLTPAQLSALRQDTVAAGDV